MWDDWINRALPPTRYHARKRFSLDSPIIAHQAAGLNLQVPVVCTKCNCEWMSAVSLKVKERFGPAMLKGEPFSIGARDAAILAAFTFMKAVVTDHMADDHDPFFTRGERERFSTTLALPPLTKAWLAAYRGRAKMSARSVAGVVNTTSPSPIYGMQFFSFTYILGQLALQLLAPRWQDIRDRGRPLFSLSPNRFWDSSTILFWPHDGTILSWPPSKYLADDTIQGFVERLGNPVNVPIS